MDDLTDKSNFTEQKDFMILFQTNKGSSQIRAAIPYLTDQIRAKVSLTLICSGLPLFD